MVLLKSLLQKFPALWSYFVKWRARQQESAYRRWREHYATVKKPTSTLQLTKVPTVRSIGSVRTFAIVPSWSWHDALIRDLELLGPVVRFDYAKDCTLKESSHYDRRFFEWRRKSNDDLLLRLQEAHAKEPFDWLFAYAQGDHLLASTMNEIRAKYQIPTVNMCLDDKNTWNSGTLDGQVAGSQGLASAFDLWWTSARVCADWITAEGGRPLYLPEGCNPGSPPPPLRAFTIPVSFVGAAYGSRPAMVSFLRQHGIPVQTFGSGWGPETAVSSKEMSDIFKKSQLNLGHGGIGYSENITNVKGRDFDIPAAGGGAYLTTYNPDLAQHFHIGEEILCWHSYDDLLEQIRYYLARPELCRAIADKAFTRCVCEHRWLHRYTQICSVFGILPPPVQSGACDTKTLNQLDHEA